MSSTTRRAGLGLLAFACLAAIALSLLLGAASPSLFVALREPASVDRAVLLSRAARVALGAVTGAALATVGAALQAALRNPMGDPFALGVSGGAALGASLAVLLGAAALVPLAAFAGALGVTVLVLGIARGAGRVDALSLLLAGLVLNACTGAALALVRALSTAAQAQQTLGLLLGAVADPSPATLLLVAVLVALGLGVLFALAPWLDLLALGEDAAASLGVAPGRALGVVFFAASLAVAAVVSVCGLIPFVGLLVPHAARWWVGGTHRRLLPASALLGAALVTVADGVCRVLWRVAQTEPPVGALTALLGGPFFLLLLRRRGARG